MTDNLFEKSLEFYNDQDKFISEVDELIESLKELKYKYYQDVGFSRSYCLNEEQIQVERQQAETEAGRKHFKLFFDNVYKANASAGTRFYSLINDMKRTQNKVLNMRIEYLKYSLDL